MIEFELEISPQCRGGQHYSYFSANSTIEVVETLKDEWYRSGLSRFGGEFFLWAFLKDADGNVAKLFYGNCTLELTGELAFIVETDHNDDDDWFSFGLSSVKETDDFYIL